MLLTVHCFVLPCLWWIIFKCACFGAYVCLVLLLSIPLQKFNEHYLYRLKKVLCSFIKRYLQFIIDPEMKVIKQKSTNERNNPYVTQIFCKLVLDFSKKNYFLPVLKCLCRKKVVLLIWGEKSTFFPQIGFLQTSFSKKHFPD